MRELERRTYHIPLGVSSNEYAAILGQANDNQRENGGTHHRGDRGMLVHRYATTGVLKRVN